MSMVGDGFRSYPGKVEMEALPPTVFFWHVGNGTGTTVILLKTGFCSGGRGGADSTGGGPFFVVSERFGGLGTGMAGFFWMGIGGLLGGWGTGGGGPLGW